MDLNTKLQIVELIIIGIIGILAFYIGFQQNQINKRALGLNDYADVFLMPQTLLSKDGGGVEEIIGYNLLIKNASSYPIYLNQYVINGVKKDVGASIIPTNSDNWFKVPLTEDIQNKKVFSIDIYFEDFTGRKYMTVGFGEFNGGWSVKSKKRIEIQ